MKRLSITLVSIWALWLPLQAAAQSPLAELARQEAARRKTTSTGRVFTNDSLKPAPQPSAGAVTSTPGTTLPPPPPLPNDAPAKADQPATDAKAPATAGTATATAQDKTEAYWRGRITAARDNLARSQTFQLALQARISALNTDFVNRDDPAQRAVVASDRVKAQTELDRVNKEITKYQTELTAIAEEGRRAGVPAAWLR
jgi:hypothetical protein